MQVRVLTHPIAVTPDVDQVAVVEHPVDERRLPARNGCSPDRYAAVSVEQRGLRFVRYADDVAIYVGSRRSAERVLEGITQWIERHLRLRVNREKSGAGPTGQRKLLGFLIHPDGRLDLADESIERYKAQVRTTWRACSGLSGREIIARWRAYVLGWWNYFRLAGRRLHARLRRWGLLTPQDLAAAH